MIAMKKGTTAPAAWGNCRRCRTILEATDTGFLAAYCSQCAPDAPAQQPERKAMTEAQLLQEIKDNIVHMTGAGPHIAARDRGYRNHFCATIGSKDHDYMVEAVRRGFCEMGIPDPGVVPRSHFFYATREGCAFAGLPAKVIKKVFA